MNTELYNQVNPLVRIEEAKLLSQSDYQRLLAASSPEEIAQLLQGTPYETFVNQSDFFTSYETYLSNERVRLFKKMASMVPDQEVIQLYSMISTYHNFKLLTKGYYSQQDLSAYAIEDGQFSISSINSTIRNKKSASIDGLYLESMIACRDYVDEYQDISGIDIIYDRYYIQHQLAAAKALNDQSVQKIMTAYIDLLNMTVLLREARQGKRTSFLEAVLSDQGSLPVSELLPLVALTIPQILDNFRQTRYSTAFSGENLEDHLYLLDVYRDNYLTDLYCREKLAAFGPMPLLGLLQGKEIEIKNLQLIITGVTLGLSPEIVKERMRRPYEL